MLTLTLTGQRGEEVTEMTMERMYEIRRQKDRKAAKLIQRMIDAAKKRTPRPCRRCAADPRDTPLRQRRFVI